MKVLIVVAVFALVGAVYADVALKLNAEQQKAAENAVAECIKETKTTADKVNALRSGDFGSIDGNGKCFVKCFQGKFGLFANGAPQPDTALKVFGPIVGVDKVKAIGAKCDGTKGSDDCDTAFQIHKCYHNEKASAL